MNLSLLKRPRGRKKDPTCYPQVLGSALKSTWPSRCILTLYTPPTLPTPIGT